MWMYRGRSSPDALDLSGNHTPLVVTLAPVSEAIWTNRKKGIGVASTLEHEYAESHKKEAKKRDTVSLTCCCVDPFVTKYLFLKSLISMSCVN